MTPWIALALFGAWPFVSFLGHNQEDAPLYWNTVALSGLIFVALLAAAAAVGRLLFRRAEFARIANPLAVGAVCFFNYLALAGPLSELGISLGTVKLAIWGVLTLAVMTAAWRLSRHAQTSLVLCVVAAVMVAVPAVQLVLFALGTRSDAGATSAASVERIESDAAQPNVYWIVLDAYARADVLEAYLGHRNDRLLEALRTRGFFVADRAFSNYASTSLSLSTTATMDYYLPVGEKLHASLWTARLQGFNPVVDRFLARGYAYVHAEPGGNNLKTRCGGREALCITAKARGAVSINEAEVALLQLTPLYPVVRRLLPDFLSFDFTSLADVAAKLEPRRGTPLFVFAHVLSPHPPPRYNPDCSPIGRVEWDLAGDDNERFIEAYLTDLRCLNPDLMRFVDTVLAKDPTDPIIIVQGDHGFRGPPIPATPEAAAVLDPRLLRHAILHAMRLPARCAKTLDHAFSSVNTFRVVFACLGDVGLEPLPDRLFAHGPGGVTPLEVN